MTRPFAAPNLALRSARPAGVARRGPGTTRRALGALAAALVVATGCWKLESTAPGGTGSTFLFKANPCASPDTVQAPVSGAQRVDCSNGGTTVILAGAGASYVIVPEFATDQAPLGFVSYAVDTGQISATAPNLRAAVRARAGAGGAAAPVLAGRPSIAQRAADARLRARGRRLAEAGVYRASRLLAAPPVRAVPPQGSIRSFKVLSDLFGTSNSFASVNAQLAYIGANVLLYVDTQAPAGGFDSTTLATYGQYIDQTLFPIDTATFGVPTDIDANGHVIVLMSGVVNGDTPTTICSQGFVAGFFNPEDFTATATDSNSNQGEIFYTVVPDPSGTRSCPLTAADVQNLVPATFLHELQHLVNFAQHVVVAGGQPGASWLDEGLSIAAEEMGSLYYEAKCPPPSCRTDPTQLFPDSAQPFIGGFLYDSYEYALLPDTASITLENDGDPGAAWRGGEWLLIRWLADHKGNGVLRQLEQGPSDGVAALEQVSGESFPQLFADFGLALYTDSLPGLPRATAPAANRFLSRNLRQLWARLYATSGPAPDIPLAMPVQLFPVGADTSTFVLLPGTVTYFRLDTPPGSATVSLRFAGPAGAAFATNLVPQIAVFRLPPGQ